MELPVAKPITVSILETQSLSLFSKSIYPIHGKSYDLYLESDIYNNIHKSIVSIKVLNMELRDVIAVSEYEGLFHSKSVKISDTEYLIKLEKNYEWSESDTPFYVINIYPLGSSPLTLYIYLDIND